MKPMLEKMSYRDGGGTASGWEWALRRGDERPSSEPLGWAGLRALSIRVFRNSAGREHDDVFA